MPDVPRLSPAVVCAWSEAQTVAGVDQPLAYAWVPERPTLVLGLSQNAECELHLDNARADDVAILRRASGGGAVLLTEGVLCFGVIAPLAFLGKEAGIHGAFRTLTAHVVDACQALGVDAQGAGLSDIAAPDPATGTLRKLAGCAQLRKKTAVLVHGSLLVSADVSQFTRYLAYPSETPEYRQERPHTVFCQTLQTLLGQACTVASTEKLLCQFAETRHWRWLNPPAELAGEAGRLLRTKYHTPDWNLHKKRP